MKKFIQIINLQHKKNFFDRLKEICLTMAIRIQLILTVFYCFLQSHADLQIFPKNTEYQKNRYLPLSKIGENGHNNNRKQVYFDPKLVKSWSSGLINFKYTEKIEYFDLHVNRSRLDDMNQFSDEVRIKNNNSQMPKFKLHLQKNLPPKYYLRGFENGLFRLKFPIYFLKR